MAPSISIREYIRWLPNEQSEPTQTIVLTSAENRFVDIRILKPERPGADVETIHDQLLPFSRLDWAFAGTSSTETIEQPDGKQLVHSKWKHWIDSRHINPDEVTDEGDMLPQGKGVTLERGSMVNPATGQMTQYEESWRDVAPKPIKDKDKPEKVCVVLLLHDDEHKARGMVIRVGQYCQGFMRVGDKVALERWSWTGHGKWQRLLRMGDLFLPCGPAMENQYLKLGGEVSYGDYVWKVVELSDL